MMATDSLFSRTQADVISISRGTNDICVVENSPQSLVELTLRPSTCSASSRNLEYPLDRIDDGFDHDLDDKRDKTVFPAILDLRASNTTNNVTKPSSFGLLSEGFYNDNLVPVPPDANKQEEIERSNDGMSSMTKVTDNAHKSHSKKRSRKAKKKSSKHPVLRRSQTSLHMYHLPQQAKSTNGASKLHFTITAQGAQGNVTADLAILTAQCKAVKIHQHFEPKVKISPTKQNSYTAKNFSIVSKPTDDSNQRIVSKSTNAISESKTNSKPHYSISSPSPVHLTRKSLAQAENVYLQKVTKVYLSEKHSGVLKEDGTEFPCAPPATPTPEQLRKYEYIPSLKDVRSQRAVRQKLQVMERKEQHKEERKREEQAKIDRALQRDRESELRRRQRQEIYALNKIMTELEHKRFLEFCKSKGIEP